MDRDTWRTSPAPPQVGHLCFEEFGRAVNRTFLHVRHDVTAFDTRFLCRTSRSHAVDERAASVSIEIQYLSQRPREILKFEAKPNG